MAELRIGIAGAGVLGRLLAWQLSRAGHAVTVFDPAPGPQAPAIGTLSAAATPHAAGFTAAGMLSPLAELDNGGVEVASLGWRSLALWRGVSDALREGGATQPLFAQHGSLMLAHGSDLGAAQRVLDRLSNAQRLPADVPAPQRLDREALAATEPAIAPGLHAWLLPQEAQVMPRELLHALAVQANRVHWCWGERVHRVEAKRITLTDGEALSFDLAVDTRGLGARPELSLRGEIPRERALRGEDLSLRALRGEDRSVHALRGEDMPEHALRGEETSGHALRGVRGEIIWLHAPGVALQRPVRLLHPRHRVYIVPRPGNLFIVGASEIESEDRSQVSLRTAVELMAAAHSAVPGLAEARIVHMESNLRPALPDNQARTLFEPGLLRINGLFRHGWLLAPALVEDALVELGLPPAPLRGFPPPVPEGGRTLRPGQARSAAAPDKTLASTASSAVPPAPLRDFPPPVPEGEHRLRRGEARSTTVLDQAPAPVKPC